MRQQERAIQLQSLFFLSSIESIISNFKHGIIWIYLNSIVTLEDEEFHHLVNVMRSRVGEKVCLFNIFKELVSAFSFYVFFVYFCKLFFAIHSILPHISVIFQEADTLL